MILRLTIALSFVIGQCVAQNMRYQALLNDPEWNEGSIILTDQTELKGLINYNNRKSVVSFESGSVSKSLMARNILGFEFYDQRENRQRVFYSLEAEDTKLPGADSFIFEVLKEFKTFAVLLKTDPVKFESKKSLAPSTLDSNTDGLYYRQYVKITQRETLYLFPAEGKATLLMEVEFRQSEGRIIERKKTKNKLINKELLVRCVGDYYAELESYATRFGLSFEQKDDLLKIFDYYEELIEIK